MSHSRKISGENQLKNSTAHLDKSFCGNWLPWTITRQLNAHRWTSTLTDPILAMSASSPNFSPPRGGHKARPGPRRCSDAATAVAGAECSFGRLKAMQRLMTHNNNAISSRGIIISPSFLNTIYKSQGKVFNSMWAQRAMRSTVSEAMCSWNDKHCYT